MVRARRQPAGGSTDWVAAMRDPMSWSVPVFRAFGIPVRVHLLFFLVTGGLFLRQVVFTKDNPVWWPDVFLFSIVLLFGIILLHEFGHCFAARAVDGESDKYPDLAPGRPGLRRSCRRSPRAHLFITAAAGPAVNLLICFLTVRPAPGRSVGCLPNCQPAGQRVRQSRCIDYKDGHATSPSGYRLKFVPAGHGAADAS